VTPAVRNDLNVASQVPIGQIVRRFRDLGMHLGQLRELLQALDAASRNHLIVAHQSWADRESRPRSTLAEPWLSFPRMVDLPVQVSLASLQRWWAEAGEDDVLRIGRNRLTWSSGCHSAAVVLDWEQLPMELQIYHWSTGRTLLDLVPRRRPRRLGPYFASGHRLMDELRSGILDHAREDSQTGRIALHAGPKAAIRPIVRSSESHSKEVAIQPEWGYGGAVTGGSQGPVVKSWRSASSLLMHGAPSPAA
jgi:DNA-binding transcriptional MerR regulator